MARGHILKCGKCQCEFLEEENKGTLQCFDTFYTIDFKTCRKIKADHRAYVDESRDGFSSGFSWSHLTWQKWAWSFEDKLPIHTSVLKKLTQKPSKLSVIDFPKYERLLAAHMKMVNGNGDSSQVEFDDIQMVTDDDHDRHDTFEQLSDDEFLSSGDDQNDSDSENSDTIEQVTLDKESVFKIVCIARFDWRQKFVVLKDIFQRDCEIIFNTTSRSGPVQKYWTTIEYQQNTKKRKEYLARQKTLM